MYINPFWAGVIATVLFEVLATAGWGIAFACKNRKK